MTSRRQFLTGASVLLAAPVLLKAGTAFAQDLRVQRLPVLETGTETAGGRHFALSIAESATEFRAGVRTPTLGINADFLGPVLQARAGEHLSFDVSNTLSEEATLHWHGMHLPAAMDGGPHQPIRPGGVWSPEFDLLQKAGTFWFHGHRHGQTGRHVWAGMAGLIRVLDDEEAALPLPRTYGEDDFTLVLQDRRFAADGSMPYDLTMHDQMAGMQGDVPLTNGQFDTAILPEADLIRLRLLNGSNGSFYRLHLSDGRTFHQIASDGGLLAAPVSLTEALLAPGERAEVLIDLSDKSRVDLLAEVWGSEVAMMGSRGIARFLQIVPQGQAGTSPDLPASLARLDAPTMPETRRALDLSMSGMGMMGNFLINGQQFDHERIDFAVPVDTAETWVIRNTTPMIHPIHIHDVQFRILTRNGLPPPAREAGLKDTVVVNPDETVEVALRFSDFADTHYPYMFHCHILEHEDAGMMGQFTVV